MYDAAEDSVCAALRNLEVAVKLEEFGEERENESEGYLRTLNR